MRTRKCEAFGVRQSSGALAFSDRWALVWPVGPGALIRGLDRQGKWDNSVESAACPLPERQQAKLTKTGSFNVIRSEMEGTVISKCLLSNHTRLLSLFLHRSNPCFIRSLSFRPCLLGEITA